MVKQKLVFDLVEGKHNGAWLNDYKTSKNGKGRKPKIRRTATSKIKSLLPFLETEEYFPYNLNPRDHVHEYERRDGEKIILLVPDEDIDGVNYEETVLAQIIDQKDDEKEELKQENERLNKKVKKLKRQVKKLEREEEEKNKNSSSGREFDSVSCKRCGQDFKPQKWSSRNGKCPNPNCNHTMTRYRK